MLLIKTEGIWTLPFSFQSTWLNSHHTTGCLFFEAICIAAEYRNCLVLYSHVKTVVFLNSLFSFHPNWLPPLSEFISTALCTGLCDLNFMTLSPNLILWYKLIFLCWSFKDIFLISMAGKHVEAKRNNMQFCIALKFLAAVHSTNLLLKLYFSPISLLSLLPTNNLSVLRSYLFCSSLIIPVAYQPSICPFFYGYSSNHSAIKAFPGLEKSQQLQRYLYLKLQY